MLGNSRLHNWFQKGVGTTLVVAAIVVIVASLYVLRLNHNEFQRFQTVLEDLNVPSSWVPAGTTTYGSVLEIDAGIHLEALYLVEKDFQAVRADVAAMLDGLHTRTFCWPLPETVATRCETTVKIDGDVVTVDINRMDLPARFHHLDLPAGHTGVRLNIGF